jgi:hypothetical protein
MRAFGMRALFSLLLSPLFGCNRGSRAPRVSVSSRPKKRSHRSHALTLSPLSRSHRSHTITLSPLSRAALAADTLQSVADPLSVPLSTLSFRALFPCSLLNALIICWLSMPSFDVENASEQVRRSKRAINCPLGLRTLPRCLRGSAPRPRRAGRQSQAQR